MEIARDRTRLILNSMITARPLCNRREFLIALGAGAPFGFLACQEPEPDVLRAGDEVIAPIAGWETNVHVERALDSQSIKYDARACSVPHTLDVEIGDQIRVRRNSNDQAIYTVEQKR